MANTNRFLNALQQNGFAQIIGEKKSLMKGRPSRGVFHLGDIHVKGRDSFLHILQKQNLIPGIQLVKGAAGPGQYGYVSACQNTLRHTAANGLKALLPRGLLTDFICSFLYSGQWSS